jgi:peroxiredoxin Q/BCP
LAPDSILHLDNGTTVALSSLRGRPAVLYFYPADDSGGCIDENLEFSQRAEQFDALGAALVGVSPDNIESHLKFRKKYGLVVPLAADPERHTIEAFGLWQPKSLYGRSFMGLIRTSFIVAADGRIARIIRATRIRGHAEKLLQAAQEIAVD